MPFFQHPDSFRQYFELHGRANPAPAIVLCHGAGGNALSWWQQLAALSRDQPALVFDHRHFGRSPDVAGGPGRAAFATDLARLLDHLALGPVVLVAHSMAGRTAVGMLRLRPDLVLGVLFSGTHAGALDDVSRALQHYHRAGPLGHLPLRRRALHPAFAEHHPQMAFLYESIARRNPPRSRDFLAVPPNYRGSTVEMLRPVASRLRFVVGGADAVVPPEVVRRAAKLVGAPCHVIARGGHSTYFERPEEFNALVRLHVDSLQRS